MNKVNYEKRVFNLHLAKKIIEGKIKGYICTEQGHIVSRFLSNVHLNRFGDIYIFTVNFPDRERVVIINTDGYIVLEDTILNDRLSIYLECEEPRFEPFQKVLTRDKEENDWIADFFSHYDKDQDFPYVCVGAKWKYCIPYNDSTKHLLGTSDDY